MCAFKTSPDRDEILNRLRQGESPANLARQFNRATVYYLNKQLQDGKFEFDDEPSGIPYSPPQVVLPGDTSPTLKVAKKAPKARSTSSSGTTGAIIHEMPERILPGSRMLPEDALNAVRGVMELRNRPKVLNMPTPELLYPAMVIAIKEWGWPAMMPQDFIDAVLDKFMSACDIEFNVYTRRSEVEKMLKYAMQAGYIPNNGNNQVQQSSLLAGVVADNNINGEEKDDDSTTGIAQSTGEQSGTGNESGGSSQDEIGGSSSTERGNGSIPI